MRCKSISPSHRPTPQPKEIHAAYETNRREATEELLHLVAAAMRSVWTLNRGTTHQELGGGDLRIQPCDPMEWPVEVFMASLKLVDWDFLLPMTCFYPVYQCWIFSMDSILSAPAMNDLNVPFGPTFKIQSYEKKIYIYIYLCYVLFGYCWIHLWHMHFVMRCVKWTFETSSEKSWFCPIDVPNWWTSDVGAALGSKPNRLATKCKENADMHHFIIKPSINIRTPNCIILSRSHGYPGDYPHRGLQDAAADLHGALAHLGPVGLKCWVERHSAWMPGWPSKVR